MSNRNKLNNNSTLQIKSDDILRLIGAHLTEQGHHQTARTLQQETHVGLAASFVTDSLPHWVRAGQWDAVLTALEALDAQLNPAVPSLQAQAYVCTILELADQSEWDVAYATHRLVQHFLHQQHPHDDAVSHDSMTWGRLVEQKLAALASLRQTNPNAPVPQNYYDGGQRQAPRDRLALEIEEHIPSHPRQRLLSLLQQAVQWQSHTGLLPHVKRYWSDDDEESRNDNKRKKRKKQFDLVLGNVRSDAVAVDDLDHFVQEDREPIAQEVYSDISFGKQATAEAALFTPDGANLITGSSDGLIELWDARHSYAKLNTQDYDYQKQDQLMGHDQAVTALAISNDGALLASGAQDGTICVWNVATGKALRQLSSGGRTAVTCLSFTPDARRLLVGQDTVVREFGLRTGRVMQEFRGHTSYLTACHYVVDEDDVSVVTSSGDGTVRIWKGSTGEVLHMFQPRDHFAVGQNMAVNQLTDATETVPVHTVIPLNSKKLLVVPRSTVAFLVDAQGQVERRFEAPGVVVAATVSPAQRTLYAVQEDGACSVFHLPTSELVSSIRDFGAQSSRTKEQNGAEIAALLHHPYKHILGAFSNDKRQSKGKLVLWK